MAVTKVGSSLAQISNATSATLAKPAGVAAGDLIVILYGGDGTGGSASPGSGSGHAALTPPAGFTSFHYQCGSGDNWLEWVMYRVADGTEASTFTPSTSSAIPDGGAVCVVYRGVDATRPFVGASVDWSLNGVANGFNGSLCGARGVAGFVGALVQQSGSASVSWPSGWDTSTQGAGGTGSSSGGMTVYLAADLTVGDGFIPAGNVTLAGANWMINNAYVLRAAGGPATSTDVVQYFFTEGSPGTFNLPLPTQAHNTLAIGLQGFGQNGGGGVPQFTSVSDGRHTLIPSADAQTAAANYGLHTRWYYVEDCLAGTESVTVATDIGTYFRITILELTPSHYDNSNGVHATGVVTPADLTAGSITPTAPNGVAAVIINQDNGSSASWAPTGTWETFAADQAGAGGTYSAMSLLGSPAAPVDMGANYGVSAQTISYTASGLTFVPKGGAAPVNLTASAAAVGAAIAAITLPAKLTPTTTAIGATAVALRAPALLGAAAQASAVVGVSVAAAAALAAGAQAMGASSVILRASATVVPATQATSTAGATVTTSTVPLLSLAAQAAGAATALPRAPAALMLTVGASTQAIAAVATRVFLAPQAVAVTHATGGVVTVLAYAFVTSASMTFTLVTTEST